MEPDNDALDAVAFLRDVVGVGDEGLSRALAGVSCERHFGCGSTILRAGEVSSYLDFLVSGIGRIYVSDENGGETTSSFLSIPGEPMVTTAPLDAPSPSSCVALTKVHVLSVDLTSVMLLLDTSIEANRFYNKMLRTAWGANHEMKLNMCRLSAKERVRWFMKTYPGVIEASPAKYVASFLGMTPVTLSRSRTALKREEAGN